MATGLLLLLAGLAAAVPAIGSGAEKPNVVILMADDLGYADLGCQGRNKDVRTPHIDALAAGGVRFTNAYATASMCAPARAGLLSGRYQQRCGFEFDVGAPPAAHASQTFGLPREEATLAERLKTAGYATALVGKWHLGFSEHLQPTARGFDSFFGFLTGWHTYLPGGRNVGTLLRNGAAAKEEDYLTDAFAREACEFVARKGHGSIYLHLAFNAVHFPMMATPALEERCKHIADPQRRTYAAMLLAMDDAVGRVLATLREKQAGDNTLIFFLGDNGGSPNQNWADNSPLRGEKMQMYEGGIRIPMILQWKGRIPAGQVCEHPVSALDIHATVLAAAGIPAPVDKPLDGVDLVPFVTGERSGPPHETLFWRDGSGIAVRKGDWKLLQSNGGHGQLYNLRSDISERDDLAAKEPQKFDELVAAWDAWNKEVSAARK